MTQTLLSWLLVGVVLALVWGGPRLKARYPRSWWLVIGFPCAAVRALLTWRRLAVECDVVVTRRPQIAVLGGLIVRGRAVRVLTPRVGLPRPVRGGAPAMTVTVRLHPGQTPDQIAACADALAHAWRMHAVRVTSPARGRVLLTCLPLDPLAEVVAPDPPTQPPVDAGGLLRVSLGRCEDGAGWCIDLRTQPHWLVVGATQSGKSTWLAALVSGLAPRPVALVGIDLKGGMELSLFEPRLSALATDRPQAVRLLAALVDLAHERMATCRVHGVRSVWDLPDDIRPVPVLVLVDEIAELFLAASRAEKDEAAQASTALVRLAQLGRALAVHLVVAGQRVGSDLGPGATALRAQLGGRVCHRVNDPGTAEMTLGDLAPDAVAAAQSITETDAGIAVTTLGASWLRARAAYVSAGAAAHTSAQYAHVTPAMPELVGALMPPEMRKGV